jgi:beta-glucosidase-like glycosyl hydrolase
VNAMRHRLLTVLTLTVCLLAATPMISSAVDQPDPTACPLNTWPSAVTDLPWMQQSYQDRYSPEQLATQVVNCEEQLHASNALASEIALTTLRFVTGSQWQNQNNWLTVAGSPYSYMPDFNSLGIPSITLEDGPIGIRYQKAPAASLPTTFPNELALAATMDANVAAAYGEQLGTEAALLNYQGIQAPDLNIARVPTWGRISETFGENPTLAGIMGQAEVSSLISRVPFVVLKHFGAYGQENSRRVLSQLVSEKTLYDNYLRPFAIAQQGGAAALASGRRHDLLMMCSYGDINGSQSCTSTTLSTALANFKFNGLVRSDLDVRSGVGSLYASGVSLIKPQGALNISSMQALSTATKQAIHNAAVVVVTEMFRTSLVTPTGVLDRNVSATLSTTMHDQGISVANDIERRAAVLLKNNGAFPLAKSGSTLLLAMQDLKNTCRALATSMNQQGYTTTCQILNPPLSSSVKPFGKISDANGKVRKEATAVWVAPRTGNYFFQQQTTGNSELKVNGVRTIVVNGNAEFPYPNFVSFRANAGQAISLRLSWLQKAPNFSIASLDNTLQTANDAMKSAARVVVMANDVGREGADRSTLELPYGYDALIKVAAATKPTSVALFTTGPVTMPWIASVDGVFEFWNGPGDATADNAITRLTPAIADLISGVTTPMGHLPITFPAATATSPSGFNNQTFWPGIKNQVNLNSAPNGGLGLGFNWYQSSSWPVLFPFGFGLTYPTTSSTFPTSSVSCATATATSLCLRVQPRVTMSDVVKNFTTISQLYLAPPATSGQPKLLLGAVRATQCRTTTGASTTTSNTCISGNTNAVVTALQSGTWDSTNRQYQFAPGCYSFILAENARDAFDILATPRQGTHPSAIVHATAPFSASTEITAGACPA